MPQRNPQYLFLNRVPGVHYRQNDPNSIGDDLFREPLNTLGLPPASSPTGASADTGLADDACLLG